MNDVPRNGTAGWLEASWSFNHHADGWDVWLVADDGRPFRLLAIPGSGPDYWVGYQPESKEWWAFKGRTSSLPLDVRTSCEALCQLMQ